MVQTAGGFVGLWCRGSGREQSNPRRKRDEQQKTQGVRGAREQGDGRERLGLGRCVVSFALEQETGKAKRGIASLSLVVGAWNTDAAVDLNNGKAKRGKS